ncbi:MAG: glycosyltransferase [Actinomycetota bacterium]|nr:glycosyltransferase [Actinomycetota bacterium]
MSEEVGDMKKKMNVAVVGNYLPRQCGIATFTYDVATWLERTLDPASDVFVVAMNDRPEGYDYPPIVRFEILASNIRDYPRAADFINLSDVDIVCLQHEFGIFGGPRGIYITDFLRELKRPVVTTVHTVLSDPEPDRLRALVQVSELSDALVVMSKKSIDLLTSRYKIPAEKVHLIHHGAQDFPFVDPNQYKGKWALAGKRVILTFGLLSARKGIEYMIEAMPQIVEQFPDAVYVVLGATHPPAKRREGEKYRFMLKSLARELGVEDNVIFYERFVSLEQLVEFLACCDIYVTPYLERNQIVSGTLAYAVAVGKPVISTPYYYAEELLADGRGVIVDFRNPRALADAVTDLFANPEKMESLRRRAYEFGRGLIWEEVIKDYIRLFDSVLAGRRVSVAPVGARKVSPRHLPGPRIKYLLNLTDDTGLISLAHYDIPEKRSGYDTGENALALAAAVIYGVQTAEDSSLELAKRYISFLRYMQLPGGKFHGHLTCDRKFSDKTGSEECQGKVLLGLGIAVALELNEGIASLAKVMFDELISNLDMRKVKGIAYAICGCYHYLTRFPGAIAVSLKLERMAKKLTEAYERESREEWKWFEGSLSLSNGVLPRAALLAHRITDDAELKRIGLESLEFLLDLSYRDGMFDLVGDSGFLSRGGERARFRQLPAEAASIVEACVDAYVAVKDERYLELARAAMEWFLGRNVFRKSLYDFAQGSCSDGINAKGLDPNRGASAIVHFLLALLRIAAAVHIETAETENVVA